MNDDQEKRYQQFTRDTALEIHHTRNSIASLSNVYSKSRIIMFYWEHFQQIP